MRRTILLLPWVFWTAFSVCCEGVDSSTPGYCGRDFVYPPDFATYDGEELDGDARICVITEPPLDERAFEIGLSQVAGRLIVDGPARRSTLTFPALTSAMSMAFRGCQLARARFPALVGGSDLALTCDMPGLEPFVLEAGQITELDTVYLSGRAAIDAPQLASIGSIDLFEVKLEGLFVSHVDPMAVGRVTIISSSLNDVRMEGIESIDTLELLGAVDDLRLDAFPDLRLLRRLYINGNPDLRACTLDAFLAQLSAAPESVEIANMTLVSCP